MSKGKNVRTEIEDELTSFASSLTMDAGGKDSYDSANSAFIAP